MRARAAVVGIVVAALLLLSSGAVPNGASPSVRTTGLPSPAAPRPLPAGTIDRSTVRGSGTPGPLPGWNWSNLTSWTVAGGSPLAGALQTAAWDPALGGILALVANSSTVSTWLLRNGSWSLLRGVSTPQLLGSEMVYDTADGYMVQYGGSNATTGVLSNATWIFYRSGWIGIDPSTTPRADLAFGLVYDPAAQEVVLTDGYSGSSPYNQTWLFRHAEWTPGPTFPGPGLFYPLMAYEAATGAAILFGGVTASAAADDQTWAFRIGGWSRGNATGEPPAPSPWVGSMGADPATGGVLLVEDLNGTENGPLATWYYLNGTWSSRTATVGAAPAESEGVLVSDPGGNGTAYIGGTLYIPIGGGGAGGGYYLPAPLTWLLHAPLQLALQADPPVTTAEIGRATEFRAVATGGVGFDPTFSWAIPAAGCGTPNGSRLTCPDNATGPYAISVAVRDPGDGPVTASYNYTVVRPTLGAPVASRASVDVGQPVTFSLPLPSGAPPLSIGWLGLPPGCFLPAAASVTCAPESPGTYAVRGNVSYPNGTTVVGGALPFPVDADPIAGPILLRTSGGTNATVDVGQWANFSAVPASPGSGGPYRYAWTGLPAGCPPVNGSALDCRPASAGIDAVSVVVTDSNGQSSSSPPVVLAVNPALAVVPTLLAGTLAVDSPTTWAGTVSGGTAPYALSWYVGGTEVGQGPFLSYRFPSTGPVTVTVRANDSAGAAASDLLVAEVGAAVPGGTGSGSGGGLSVSQSAAIDGALLLALGAVVGVVYVLARRGRPPAATPPAPAEGGAPPPGHPAGPPTAPAGPAGGSSSGPPVGSPPPAG